MKRLLVRRQNALGTGTAQIVTFLLLAILALRSLKAQTIESSGASPALTADWTRQPPTVWHQSTHTSLPFQRLLAHRHNGAQQFRDEYPGRWLIIWNDATCLPRRLIGTGLVLSEGAGASLPEDDAPETSAPGSFSLAEIEPSLLSFLERHPSLFPVATSEDLRLRHAFRMRGVLVVNYQQWRGGVPVFGSRLVAVVTESGKIVDVVADLLPPELVDTVLEAPEITLDDAIRRARAHLGEPKLRATGHLAVIPRRVAHGPVSVAGDPSNDAAPSSTHSTLTPTLAWHLRFSRDDNDSVWSYFVVATESAHRAATVGTTPAGALLGRIDHTRRATINGSVSGHATPGVLPDTDWNPPVPVPLANVEVWSGNNVAITDAEGTFDIEADGAPHVNVPLRGPFCTIENAQGETLSRMSPAPEDTATVDLTPQFDEYTTAQVNAFVHVNRAHDFVSALAPELDAVDVPVRARVNLNGLSCDARFVPEGDGILEFFRSDPCANTAYSTWIVHEYGHFLTSKVFGDMPIMPALDEGIADSLMALVTGQPVMGKAFDGANPATTEECAFSRDLSELTARFPDDLLRDPHEAGLILGHAVWRLRQRLEARYSTEEATQIVGELLVASLLLTPTSISPEIVLSFLTFDDASDEVPSDGIHNGTPHAPEILASFADVGLYPTGDLVIEHTPLPDVAADFGPVDAPAEFTIEAKVTSTFDFATVSEVLLYYQIDGQNTLESVALTPGENDSYVGTIAARSASTVRYYLEATATPGFHAVAPAGAPDLTFVFAYADVKIVYEADENDTFSQWDHDTVENGFQMNQDDWQWGAPQTGLDPENVLISGNVVDPETPYSGVGHYGNDIAVDGTSDKLYPNLAHNFLRSPSIDCTDRYGMHLRFRRWLSAEQSDVLKVLVNETVVYRSPADRDTFDPDWQLVDYPISALADNRSKVVIQFELESDGFGSAGGWNIDQLQLVSTSEVATGGPGIAGIVPTFASISGGETFTLHGTNFGHVDAGTIVTFGNDLVGNFATAEGVRLVNDGVVTGRFPRYDAGPVTVHLWTSTGTTSLPGTFTYFGPPEVMQISPDSGDRSGRVDEGPVRVQIAGQYFTPEGSRAWIGDAEIVDLMVLNESKLLAGLIPEAEAVGAVSVRIATEYGEAIVPGGFTYTAPPVLHSIEPNTGNVAERCTFEIQGDFFDPNGAIEVLFGGEPALDLVVNPRSIKGKTPEFPVDGLVDVTVMTLGGEATLPFEFGTPIFRRGDANDDGILELTDAVFILSFLFRGRERPHCEDSADVNDDAQLDIADPTALLRFLFIGATPPRPPHPLLGPDPTADDLPCKFRG